MSWELWFQNCVSQEFYLQVKDGEEKGIQGSLTSHHAELLENKLKFYVFFYSHTKMSVVVNELQLCLWLNQSLFLDSHITDQR